MTDLLAAIWSSLGKKFLIALTGLGLFAFVVGHLAGNLLILVGPDAFNAYSHKLITLGGVLYAIEAFLVLMFLIHVVFAISVTWSNWRVRGTTYTRQVSRGEPSRMTVSSKTMIWTGLVLLLFTVVHLKTFKYGPGIDEGYATVLSGEQARDLYRLVFEIFSDEVYVIGYVVAMILMGFHLRHGFWSAFQSLGAHHPRYTPAVYGVGVVAAVLLAGGFLFLPVWIYFTGAS